MPEAVLQALQTAEDAFRCCMSTKNGWGQPRCAGWALLSRAVCSAGAETNLEHACCHSLHLLFSAAPPAPPA